MISESMLTMGLEKFSEALASGDPVPGGGGASALAGALGAALASMVCNLTTGKKKYVEFEDDIQRIIADANGIQRRLLSEIDGDAEAFAPLAKAYSIPKDDPARNEILEKALCVAAKAPMGIMRLASSAISLHAELSGKGSALAISDVGVGVILCKSALMGASLNVFINTKLMKDRKTAKIFDDEANALLEEYCPLADETYEKVLNRLK